MEPFRGMRDAWLLFATRFIRLFAYGALSVVLVFYLVGLGLSESQTGLLLTATLIGDTVVSLLSHHPRRSDRTPPDADHRRHADGGGGPGLRLHRETGGCSSSRERSA